MQIQHTHFATKASVRTALKRGLARQALTHAARDEADFAALVRIATAMRPNPKALQRLAQQLAGQAGVVKVAMAEAGPVVFGRNVCEVRTRVQQTEVFAETALVYTRLGLSCGQGRVCFHLSRASFCKHALERLVERSAVALDSALLPVVDAEAVTILRGMMRGRNFSDGGDDFLSAQAGGVWAGSIDDAGLDEEWGLVGTAAMPMFSVRTYLGEDQMRPTLWWARNAAAEKQARAG